jgi:hypothetical protein
MNITFQGTQTTTTTTTYYQTTDAQCVKRCGAGGGCYLYCGNCCSDCAACATCNYCGGIGCQTGITCTGNYFTFAFFNSSTHSYSPCWGGCSTSTKTSTSTSVVNGATYTGTGTVGGPGFGSGGPFTATFADRAQYGSAWTFGHSKLNATWFDQWYIAVTGGNTSLIPSSLNFNNNIVQSDYYFTYTDGTTISAEVLRPGYATTTAAYGSDGGHGATLGYNASNGLQSYSPSGTYTGVVGAPGLGGRGGYTTDGTGIVTWNNQGTRTPTYYYGGLKYY